MAWSTRRGMGVRPRSALHRVFDVALLDTVMPGTGRGASMAL